MMMMTAVLAVGLTVVTTASETSTPSSAPSWSCAYVAERLPRTLGLLGEDTVSGEETRAVRRRLSLADAVLTRASGLTLARSLGATRLVSVRCLDHGDNIALEAQSFDAVRPAAGTPVRVDWARSQLAQAIDEVARGLTQTKPGVDLRAFRPPAAKALAKAGPALTAENPMDRARLLVAALAEDPACIDLRLSAVAALATARDFEAAIRLAEEPRGADAPPLLVRALRFQAGAAQLEAGRYADARRTFEGLVRDGETAASLSNLGVAHFRLRSPEASPFFERAALLKDVRQGEIVFNRSLAWLFEGKPERALLALDKDKAESPLEVRTLLLRVWALTLLKREAERSAAWGDLMAVAPSFSGLGTPDLARRLERIFLSEQRP